MAKSSFTVENPQGLTAKIFALDAVASESVLRQATVAAARVVHTEVKTILDSRPPAKAYERKGTKIYPGFLRDHIIIAYDKEVSVPGRIASYVVTWGKDAFYGRFVERGTSKMAAKPFLRPGFDATKQDQFVAFDSVVRAEVQELTSGR